MRAIGRVAAAGDLGLPAPSADDILALLIG